ncbi:MAG TPA: hypothetical protein VI479_23365 [Blastocatellia bacterium]
MSQAQLFLAALDFATEYVAIELEHCFEVDYAQHDVIDFADLNHNLIIAERGDNVQGASFRSIAVKIVVVTSF